MRLAGSKIACMRAPPRYGLFYDPTPVARGFPEPKVTKIATEERDVRWRCGDQPVSHQPVDFVAGQDDVPKAEADDPQSRTIAESTDKVSGVTRRLEALIAASSVLHHERDGATLGGIVGANSARGLIGADEVILRLPNAQPATSARPYRSISRSAGERSRVGSVCDCT